MKSRVVAPTSELVLSYGIDSIIQPQLSEVLESLNIKERWITDEKLNQQVGYLAGFPSFEQGEEAVNGSTVNCQGMICMCGLSSARMNVLLKTLREKGIIIPIKASVTATNQHWSFQKLLEELNKEHDAIAKMRAGK